MGRAPRTSPGGAPSGDLRALAELVDTALNGLNDLLRPMVTPEWAAVAGGPSLARSQTTSSGTGRAHRPGPRSHSEPNGPTLAATNGHGQHAPEPDLEVADEHIEIWQLVNRAQQGDGEAFGQLYDRYVDTVFRFVYFRVNDRALAEDFTSETFLRALRRINTINYQGRDIGAWFVTIARNIILDHMKSARHRLEITTGETVEGDQREPSPEAAILDLLSSERLMAAVKQLGEEQRECVLLRFIQGFSVSETAAVMGKNDGAIKALQHRAIRKLAELIGGDLR